MTMMMIQDIIKMYQIFRCLFHFYIHISLHWFSTFHPRPKSLTHTHTHSTVSRSLWLRPFGCFPIFLSLLYSSHLIIIFIFCLFCWYYSAFLWKWKMKKYEERKMSQKKEKKKMEKKKKEKDFLLFTSKKLNKVFLFLFLVRISLVYISEI